MRRAHEAARLLGVVVLCLYTYHGANAQPAGAVGTGPSAAGEPPRSVTVPFELDHNRMIVDVEFVRADGSTRKARAWVDTGNQHLIVAEPLARDLGLDLPELQDGETQHSVESASPAPGLRLGGMLLDVDGITVRVRLGLHAIPGVPAEANVPASALRHDHVVLDYPQRRLTVARPGVLKPRGIAVPCRVNPLTGLFLVAATVDGETVQLGVDNGSAGTWVSDSLTAAWQARHPEWPRATGAVGSANFFGFDFEAGGVLMRLPEMGIGALRVRDIGLLGLDQSLFDWYTRKSAGPVKGFIGGNVLRGCRLEIDFANQMTYWEAGPPHANDLDIVGLNLRPEADGRYTVAAVATRGGTPTVEGIEPGDVLIRVDGLDTADAPMGAVVDALRGEPGTTHTLVIERQGERRRIEARVMHLP